jgi:hypothetical protein
MPRFDRYAARHTYVAVIYLAGCVDRFRTIHCYCGRGRGGNEAVQKICCKV